MSSDSDLSDYERVRLDNIRRNNEFLAQLGLVPSKPKSAAPIKAERAELSNKASRKNKQVDDVPVFDEKRRRSSRLSGNFIKVKAEEDIVDTAETTDEASFYDRTPHESDQLDDFEFQVFVELRKWRLLRSRELSIAPYGLFQNRTFCEMIRRRRNDATWASHLAPSDVLSYSAEESGASVTTTSESTGSPLRTSPRKITTTSAATQKSTAGHYQQPSLLSLSVVYDPALSDQLTECFGIAAGKTREGGYAWEALAVLNTDKVMHLLEQSRSLQPSLAL